MIALHYYGYNSPLESFLCSDTTTVQFPPHILRWQNRNTTYKDGRTVLCTLSNNKTPNTVNSKLFCWPGQIKEGPVRSRIIFCRILLSPVPSPELLWSNSVVERQSTNWGELNYEQWLGLRLGQHVRSSSTSCRRPARWERWWDMRTEIWSVLHIVLRSDPLPPTTTQCHQVWSPAEPGSANKSNCKGGEISWRQVRREARPAEEKL